MSPVVTGSPAGPYADALVALLSTDPVLTAILPDGLDGVYASLPIGRKVQRPYVVVSDPVDLTDDEGSVQTEGMKAAAQIDVWSEHNGPSQVRAIQSRIRALVQRRRTLAVVGFTTRDYSLHCEEERSFSDFDPDMPQQSLWHGVQRVAAILEESC